MESLVDPFKPRSRLNRTPPSKTPVKPTVSPALLRSTAKAAPAFSSPRLVKKDVPISTSAIKASPLPVSRGLLSSAKKQMATPGRARKPLAPVAMNVQAPPPASTVDKPRKSGVATTSYPTTAPVQGAEPIVVVVPSAPIVSAPPTSPPAIAEALSVPTPASDPIVTKAAAPASSSSKAKLGAFDLRKMAQSLRAPATSSSSSTSNIPSAPCSAATTTTTTTSTTTTTPCCTSRTKKASPVCSLIPTPTKGSPSSPMPANPFVRRPKVARTPPSQSTSMETDEQDKMPTTATSRSGSSGTLATSSSSITVAAPSHAEGKVQASVNDHPPNEATPEEVQPMDVVPIIVTTSSLPSPPPTTTESSSMGPAPSLAASTSCSSSVQTEELDLQEMMEVRDRLAGQEAELKQEVGILRDRLSKQRAESERLLASWTEAHDSLQASTGELQSLQEERAMLAREVNELRTKLEPSAEAGKKADEEIQYLRLHELELRVQLSASQHHMDQISARERKLKVHLLEQEARTYELKAAFKRDYWSICAFGCNVSRRVVGAMSRMETSLDSFGKLFRDRAAQQMQRQLEEDLERMLQEKMKQSAEEKDKCLETLRKQADERLEQVTKKADKEVNKYEQLLQSKLQEIQTLQKSLADLQSRVPSTNDKQVPMETASPLPKAKKQQPPKRRRDRITTSASSSTTTTPAKVGSKASFTSPEPKRGRPAPPAPPSAMEVLGASSSPAQGSPPTTNTTTSTRATRGTTTTSTAKNATTTITTTSERRNTRKQQPEEVEEREEGVVMEEEEAASAPLRERKSRVSSSSKSTSKSATTKARKTKQVTAIAEVIREEEEEETAVAMHVSPLKKDHLVETQEVVGKTKPSVDEVDSSVSMMEQSPIKSLEHPPVTKSAITTTSMPASRPTERATSMGPARQPQQQKQLPSPAKAPLRPRQTVAGLPPAPPSLAPAAAKDKIKKLSLFASFKDKSAIPKLKVPPQKPV